MSTFNLILSSFTTFDKAAPLPSAPYLVPGVPIVDQDEKLCKQPNHLTFFVGRTTVYAMHYYRNLYRKDKKMWKVNLKSSILWDHSSFKGAPSILNLQSSHASGIQSTKDVWTAVVGAVGEFNPPEDNPAGIADMIDALFASTDPLLVNVKIILFSVTMPIGDERTGEKAVVTYACIRDPSIIEHATVHSTEVPLEQIEFT